MPVASAMMRCCCGVGDIQRSGRVPFVHHHNPVSHAQYFFELAGNHNDRNALFRQVVHQLVNLVFRPDVNAAGRVIHNQDLWVRHQPFGDDDLLLIAARQGIRRTSRFGALMARLLRLFQRGRRFGIAVDAEERGKLIQVGQRDVLAGWIASAPVPGCLRSSGTRLMPCMHRLTCALRCRLLPFKLDGAVGDLAVFAKNRRHQLRASEPISPAMPRISPRRRSKVTPSSTFTPDFESGSYRLQVFDLEDHLAGSTIALRETFCHLAAHHVADQFFLG